MLMVFQPPKSRVESINPNGLYTPGMIADILAAGESRENRQRCRLKMRRIALNKFPKEPDGKIKGDFPIPLEGWFGWRWIKELV